MHYDERPSPNGPRTEIKTHYKLRYNLAVNKRACVALVTYQARQIWPYYLTYLSLDSGVVTSPISYTATCVN